MSPRNWTTKQITVANSAVNEVVEFKRTTFLVDLSTRAINGVRPGRVTGGGYYAPGEIVNLNVESSGNGYFIAWETNDVNVSSNASTSFIMPNKNVSITALFGENM